MAKALFKGDFLIPCKILWGGITGKGEMLLRGLEILADGQNVTAG